MRRTVLWIVTLGCPALFAVTGCGTDGQEKSGSKGDGSGVRVTIGRDTTFITKPLRPDGYPDYLAALDQRLRDGVTPENNAAVPFWQAVGPKDIRKEIRDEYFRRLGVPSLPEKGGYFVYLGEYAAGRPDGKKLLDAPQDAGEDQSLWAQERAAISRPWSKEKFPILADWLAANEKSLAMLLAASKRPRRYDPLCCPQNTPGGPSLSRALSQFLPGPASQYRHLARALRVRAMLRLQEGEIDRAWEDALAVHRLARLCGRGQTFIECLVATGLEEAACSSGRALLEHGSLTAAQLATMREELGKLPPLPKAAGKFDLGERFYCLDFIASCAREGLGPTKKFLHEAIPSQDAIHTLLDPVGDKVDWNAVLRTSNSWYDRTVGALRKPTHAQRATALRKLEDDLRSQAKTAAGRHDEPQAAQSERVALAILTVMLSAAPGTPNLEDRTTARFELTKLAFALAQYHAEQGSYPEQLADLVPKYVVRLPKDIFSDAPFHYRREDDGYLLYSVGPNGKDDGGVGHEYPNEGYAKGGDDEINRVPAAMKRE
jgi:hypothetical protein